MKHVVPHLWTFELVRKSKARMDAVTSEERERVRACSIQSEGFPHAFMSGQDHRVAQPVLSRRGANTHCSCFMAWTRLLHRSEQEMTRVDIRM